MNKRVLSSLLVLSMAVAARARTYHVSTAGNDENPGSETRPLRTIQRASDMARAGDVVLVRGGVYREAVRLAFSGQRDKRITLMNYPGERPVIQPGELGQEPPGHGVLLQAQGGYQNPIGWITIEGIEIRYGWDGVKVYNAQDMIIRSCHIHGNWNQGILGNGNRVLIERNIVAGNGTNPGARPNLLHGIYATGSSFTIQNNLIHSNAAYGIQVAAYDYRPESMAGPEYAEAKNWLIANNTLAFNRNRAGMVIWQDGVENAVVQNNIFYRNGGVNGILFYGQKDRRHLVRNNIFYPPGENLMSSEEHAYQAIDNRQSDPCFAGPGSFDFRLRSDSPAIDAGVADRAPPLDFRGMPRPQGAGVDIGAYESAPAARLLRVHPENPRYFTDGRKGIWLGGHQIFVDLQDNSFNKEWVKDLRQPDYADKRSRRLDWDQYLDFVADLNFNYVRNWIIWSTGSGTAAPPDRVAFPMPFRRTGPGKANDGGLKFDLKQFDGVFFERLEKRCRDLQSRGIYVSVMLFELYGFLDGEKVNDQRLWEGNLFHGANNINGIDVDRSGNRLGEEFFSLNDPAVVEIQKAYLERMVDTLSDLDNVIWEICNEAPSAATEWQYEMMRHLKAYEAKKSKQHLVLLSPGGWTSEGWNWPDEALFIDSGADCIATANGWINKEDPKIYDIDKPVIMDLDHVAPGQCQPALIWKAFTRGYHFNLYDRPFEQPQQESRAWQIARGNVSLARALAERVSDIASMRPDEDVSSTGYCLAQEGREYIVYAEQQRDFEVNGLLAGSRYRYEWINIAEAAIQEDGVIAVDGPVHRFRPPCDGAVLFLALPEARGADQEHRKTLGEPT